jgi:hypothetical protein
MPKGDLEDITMAGDTFFLLKSNGKIYRYIPGTNAAVMITQLHYRPMDMEGMFYDYGTHALILACKSVTPGRDSCRRDLFIYDLQSMSWDTSAERGITCAEIDAYFTKTKRTISDPPSTRILKKESFFSKKGKWKWAPSAIAIDNVTGWWWILSAKSCNIIVWNPVTRTIQAMIPLDPERHLQAEGMYFLSGGELIITDEAVGRRPAQCTFYRPELVR